MTLEEATEMVNQIMPPEVQEGHNIWYEGYEFIYQNGAWVPVSE